MAVTLAELIAEPALQLVALNTHSRGGGDREISWVATTELTDPAPFLRGGELVCTTALQDRTTQEWQDLVEQLVAVPVSALCIGTGLVHDEVPPALVTAAEATGLALVNSPVSVPFIQISRFVADRIFADKYELVRSSAAAQDQLLRELLDGRTLPHLMRSLARHLGRATQVSLVDRDGRWIAGHPQPPGTGQSVPTGRVQDSDETPEPTDEVPILVDREPLAYLRARGPQARPDLLLSAANVLGLEIARRHAVLRGRRLLAGQVLEDVVQGIGSMAESRRRLADLGLEPDETHRVLMGRAHGASEALTRHPTAILRLFDEVEERHVSAWSVDGVLFVLPTDVDAQAVAEVLLSRLKDRDPRASVGVGSAHPGIAGLRTSHLEARLALDKGPGLHQAAELSVGAVLLAGADAATREVAESALRPLLKHDRDRGSELVSTLRAWLAHDCSAAATCAALHLHRNSLRYRLTQIRELTGRDLDSMTDRVDLWLALRGPNERPAPPGST